MRARREADGVGRCVRPLGVDELRIDPDVAGRAAGERGQAVSRAVGEDRAVVVVPSAVSPEYVTAPTGLSDLFAEDDRVGRPIREGTLQVIL